MLKIVGSLIVIATSIFAQVIATVDRNIIVDGDSITLSISSDSENTEFPEIAEIDGFSIQSTSSSQNIQIINGAKSTKILKNYTFSPSKDITIPSFEIKVDGDTQVTEPIEIKVSKPTQTQNPDFTLILESDKKEAYVGEPIALKVLFKRRTTAPIMDISFKVDKFDSFWSKQLKDEKQYIDGEYTIHELKYIIFPQKFGSLSIEPVKIQIATPKRGRDMFGFISQVQSWQNIYSNSLDFQIKPLIDNLKLIGDFEMEATIDKSELKVNEPLNLTLKVSGYGNLDDLDDFTLNIDGVTIYEDKAIKNYNMENGKYRGEYIKKFAILSDRDFHISPFVLSYFHIDKEQRVDIKTDEFDIKVMQSKELTKESKIETAQVIDSKSSKESTKDEVNQKDIIEKFLYLIVGVIIGLIASNYKMKMPDTKFKLKKSDRDLLKELIIKSETNSELKEIIKQLEENIYEGKKHKIDKTKI